MKRKRVIVCSIVLVVLMLGCFLGKSYIDSQRTKWGGFRYRDAELYVQQNEDGSVTEIDYGGKYNEKGQYIVPASEGYVIIHENGCENPVTGEYFFDITGQK